MIHQELAKVPCNWFCPIFIGELCGEPFVDMSGRVSIHIAFVKEHKLLAHLCIEFLDKFENLFARSWLLLSELVAGKGQDFESFRTQFISKLGQLGIV